MIHGISYLYSPSSLSLRTRSPRTPLRVLAINLDVDRIRWEQSSAQLAESAITKGSPQGFSRISGTNAASLDLPRLVADGSLTPDAYNDIIEQDHAVTGVELTLGALGC